MREQTMHPKPANQEASACTNKPIRSVKELNLQGMKRTEDQSTKGLEDTPLNSHHQYSRVVDKSWGVTSMSHYLTVKLPRLPKGFLVQQNCLAFNYRIQHKAIEIKPNSQLRTQKRLHITGSLTWRCLCMCQPLLILKPRFWCMHFLTPYQITLTTQKT